MTQAQTSTGAAFPATRHDHRTCRKTALAAAEERCAEIGGRLTPQRREVLDVLLEDHRALGAYEILEKIDWKGRRPAPTAVYRALDFLVSHGLAHKVESLNAYMACLDARRTHAAKLLICRSCGRVAELSDPAVDQAIAKAAAKTGFRVDDPVIEVLGTCPDCAARTGSNGK